MKCDPAVIESLQGVSLFHGLEPDCLDRIGQQMRRFEFAEGDHVLEADSKGKFGRLYTVMSGTADVLVRDEVVATFGPGDYFGEMSVLDGQRRSAEVRATSELTTMGLSAWNLHALLREEPDIAVHVIERLVKMLRAANEQHHH